MLIVGHKKAEKTEDTNHQPLPSEAGLSKPRAEPVSVRGAGDTWRSSCRSPCATSVGHLGAFLSACRQNGEPDTAEIPALKALWGAGVGVPGIWPPPHYRHCSPAAGCSQNKLRLLWAGGWASCCGAHSGHWGVWGPPSKVRQLYPVCLSCLGAGRGVPELAVDVGVPVNGQESSR